MQYITFYEEFIIKRKRISAGNCIAVIRENRCPDGSMECVGSVFEHPNSVCAGTAVSSEFLRTKCKRVSEAHARQVHPRLFERLDGV
jgi:hypothetical protein